MSFVMLRNQQQVQGGILNFEVLRPDGSVFSYKTFEREAADAGFHVRTGAECNPGACYNYLGVTVRVRMLTLLAVHALQLLQ
jgi:molybdenum cofactor sulfurtransferase